MVLILLEVVLVSVTQKLLKTGLYYSPHKYKNTDDPQNYKGTKYL